MFTGVALALRVALLGQSLNGDELFAFDEATRDSPAAVIRAVHRGIEITPPLFFLLAWATAHVGDATETVRIPSLVAGVALVPATYALGRAAYGRLASVLAAGVVALAPFSLFYSIEARPYMLLGLLTVLSSLTLLRALEGRGRGWWALYALLAAAMLYTHLTAVFPLLAQAGWAVLAHRSAWRPLTGSLVAAGVLFLPWLPELGTKGQLFSYGAFSFTLSRLAQVGLSVLPSQTLLPIHTQYVPWHSLPGEAPTAVFVLAGAVALAALVLRSRPARRVAASLTGLLVVLAALPPLALLVYSAAGNHDLLLPRNLMPAFPALALLVARGVELLPGAGRALCAVAILVPLAIGADESFRAEHQRADYGAVARYLDDTQPTGVPIVDVELGGGPLARALRLHLRRTHTFAELGDPRLASLGVRAGRIVAVYPGYGPLTALGRAKRLPLKPAFVRRRVIEFPGIYPLSIVTYVPSR